MKKLVVLGTALLALNAVASEIQIKGGYDFYRRHKYGAGDDFKVKDGYTFGLEYIVDNQGEFEWGLGAEYKFSSNSGKLKTNERLDADTPKSTRIYRVAPVYALGKFNMVTTDSGNDALYAVGRLGYAFAKEDDKIENDIKGGLYAGIGLGTEFGPVSVEALYERANLKNNDSRDKLDTIGVKLGYRIGQLVNDRSPKIVTNTVEVIKEVPVAPAERNINQGNTATLPFSCSANERKCVIRGFKVDGRVPNEAEASDLRTIAGVINQFAEGGSVDFVGHTDSTGSAAYNQTLSVARAQNVARLLREYGLKDTIGYGSITGQGLKNPADTNSTVQGRYNNRRVELFFNNVDFSNVRFINQ